LSFHAYFHVSDIYEILNVGSALGRGCGPLLIKRQNDTIGLENNPKILVPGIQTTANLLLQIYLVNKYFPIPIRYDKVIPLLLEKKEDLGVIIHEERFTFEKRGLEKIIDLGEFWETKTGLPIPLGCIAARRDLSEEIKLEFQESLSKSLAMAYEFPEKAKSYILENSQEKDLSVVQSHIDLYVNEYTKDLGKEGKSAIQTLYETWLELNPEQLKSKKDIFLKVS